MKPVSRQSRFSVNQSSQEVCIFRILSMVREAFSSGERILTCLRGASGVDGAALDGAGRYESATTAFRTCACGLARSEGGKEEPFRDRMLVDPFVGVGVEPPVAGVGVTCWEAEQL
jgi:hypothetical protein